MVNGQLIANCARCGAYICCVAKIRTGRSYNTAGLVKRKAEKIGGYYCQCCLRGRFGKERVWVKAHHIIPVAQGGSTELDNILLFCAECHDITHSLRRMHGNDTSMLAPGPSAASKVSHQHSDEHRSRLRTQVEQDVIESMRQAERIQKENNQ